MPAEQRAIFSIAFTCIRMDAGEFLTTTMLKRDFIMSRIQQSYCYGNPGTLQSGPASRDQNCSTIVQSNVGLVMGIVAARGAAWGRTAASFWRNCSIFEG